jgi:hypothetical protein
MFHRNLHAFFGIAAIAVAASACATENTDESDAPIASLEALEERDEGTSYNGWTQSLAAEVYTVMGISVFNHTLTRSYGDATRGGGACFVTSTGSSCSSDATCLASAQATHGAAAWGYCYANQCYTRPGAQASYCSMSPNRSAGTVQGVWLMPYSTNYALGCMTKTAGPNTACGGTNGGLYMRTVVPTTFSSQSP